MLVSVRRKAVTNLYISQHGGLFQAQLGNVDSARGGLMSAFDDPRNVAKTAAVGSAILLGGAFLFQALGYAPCAMCIWQRYPHVLGIAAGLAIFAGAPLVIFALVGAAAAAATSAFGVFHTGVEKGWWEGPSSCTGSGLDLSRMSAVDLLPGALNKPANLVMCDEVVWQFLTLSMASWNALLSALLVALWLYAWTVNGRASRKNKARASNAADL